jgi:hypothetical protein
MHPISNKFIILVGGGKSYVNSTTPKQDDLRDKK